MRLLTLTVILLISSSLFSQEIEDDPRWKILFSEPDTTNTVKIFTDANDIITFDGQVIEVHQLCDLLRPKIIKEEKSILLQSYRATSYKIYKAIYDEIMDCYSAMRNERSLEIFNKSYYELSLEDRREINRLIPKIINELEPK